MVITVEKSLLNNQSILQDFGLVEELDAQSAEIISGGHHGHHHHHHHHRHCGHHDWDRDRRDNDREYSYSIR
ncbi:hypothetical protein [Nostoc sp. NMS8]|uniref:hypothetical protein n=1 Tax=Nostoc sp. NMS8 TaxID=2815392 RepID=UPI0025E2EF0D|nr:hypothetical protein [Nostoc sp. NMS8]MBN3959403.1 hypothetical protein [Nostoc sp. NMS8]